MRSFLIYVVAVLLLGAGAVASAAAPGDVVIERQGAGEQAYAPATFPHWAHQIRYRCYVCHPAVFKMATMELQRGSLKEDRSFPAGPAIAPAPSAPKEASGAADDSSSESSEGGEAGKGETLANAANDSDAVQRAMHGPEGCGLCHKGGGPAFNVEFKNCARCHKAKD